MSPLLVLIVAVLATTYAGPIVRFAAAPALAIAFWRLALVLPVAGGLAVWERSGERGAVPSGASDGRDLALCHRRLCRRGRGARAARPRGRRPAGGIHAPRLGGVRRHGGGAHADRAHGNELRAATLPRDDRERGGAGRAGGGDT